MQIKLINSLYSQFHFLICSAPQTQNWCFFQKQCTTKVRIYKAGKQHSPAYSQTLQQFRCTLEHRAKITVVIFVKAFAVCLKKRRYELNITLHETLKQSKLNNFIMRGEILININGSFVSFCLFAHCGTFACLA